jgi:hypothetical protein
MLLFAAEGGLSVKGVRSLSRFQWIRRVLGSNRRLTVGQMRRAVRRLEERGWVVVMPAEGPAYEAVAAIDASHPLAALAAAYRTGQRWFDRSVVGRVLGAPVGSLAGVRQLAKAGFALLGADDDNVALAAADPREAVIVNEARLGPQRHGFGVRRVIEATLHVRAPGRTRVNVDDDRRLAAAEALETRWAISCDDLLCGRRRVRLISAWTISERPAAPEAETAPVRTAG